jgi:energy-coupling factor transporter ATP-binding protein EcfA2
LSRFLLLPVISGGRLCAVQREEEDEEETPTVVKGKTQTNMTAAKVARENSYLKTAKLCFLVQNPDFLAERERERERYVFMFISCSERERRSAHMHTISSAQQQKVALTVVLSLHSEAEVQAGLHIHSASSCQTALFKNCCSPPIL